MTSASHVSAEHFKNHANHTQGSTTPVSTPSEHFENHANHNGGSPTLLSAPSADFENHAKQNQGSASPVLAPSELFKNQGSGSVMSPTSVQYSNHVKQNQGHTAPKGRSSKKKGEEMSCGFGRCTPKCLQVCAVPVCYLFCICTLVLVQSFVVSGYSSSILTTIEKRYDLYGSELGFIISSYDITAVLAGIVVSYFGDSHNRSVWLSRGALLIAVGAAIFSFPHFLGGQYTPPNYNNMTGQGVSICNQSESLLADGCSPGEQRNPETWALAVFMCAFMLIGVGASPVYTLGPTYLFDNVRPDRYPVYSAVMYAMGALGPAAGFLVGAALLQLYVYPSNVPYGLKPSEPGWIGAWWLGFLVTAGLAVAVAIPLALFPRQLPESDLHCSPEDRPIFASFGNRLKDFPKSLRKLLRNLTWLTITLTIVAEQSIGTGFNRFIAKYMQLSFNLPPSSANLFTGCVLIPAAVLGIVSGGGVMNRLRPSLSGTAKLLILLNIVPTVLLATLFALGCDTINIVGVTDTYSHSPALVEPPHPGNLTAACNAGCACEAALYSPVCGTNSRTYYSACHAGCTQLHFHTDKDGEINKNYSSCACIADHDLVHSKSAANTGRCANDCRNLIPFLIILFIVVFLTTCGHNPAIILTLKSVNPNTRSFALGIQNFFSQLLAFIPAPIFFGRIFDAQCVLWTPRCDGMGACLEYDISTLPYALFGTCLGLKLLTFLFLIATWWAACRAENRKATYNLHGDITTTPMGKGTSGSVSSKMSRTASMASVSTISVSFRRDSLRDTGFTAYH